jgi:uncharacterized protein (DUF58 family)
MRREIVFDRAFLECLRRIRILARRPEGGRMEGERVTGRPGPGIEFADWRPYARGDSPREVDWRAYARLGELFVRLRAREEASSIYVLVDASASMDFGRPSKFSFARRLAAALAAVGLCGLDAVTVGLMRDGRADLGERLTGEDRLPEAVALLESARAGGRTDLARSLARFFEGASPGRAGARPEPGVVLAVSDFWSPSEAEAAERAGAGLRPVLTAAAESGFEGTLIQVLEPRELETRLAGRQRLTDAETGAELELELGARARELYREERVRHFKELAGEAAMAGFGAVSVATDATAENAILGELRRARVVG